MDTRKPFDLKYRPRILDEVIGQSGVIKILRVRSQHGTIKDRSMMFGGPKGCGKTTLARIVAKIIHCDNINSDGNPCLECNSCLLIESDNSPSYDEFDAATQGTVERIRTIISELEYGTIDGKPRVVILDEAHRLSKQAQDALLKSMEDRRIIIILCTTEPSAIRSAIRDRVYEYPVSLPSRDDIKKKLISVCESEGLSYDDEALDLISCSSNPRSSLITLDSASIFGHIDSNNVRSVCRFESKETIIELLTNIKDIQFFFSRIDLLRKTEGPGWVRDELVDAISSCVRHKHGSRLTYDLPCDFYDVLGSKWTDLAFRLSSLMKPNYSDIECCILSSFEMNNDIGTSIPLSVISSSIKVSLPPEVSEMFIVSKDTAKESGTTEINPESKPEPTIESKPELKPELKPEPKSKPVQKSVSIDGVVFTADEALTSLDSKIERRSSTPSDNSLITDTARIEVPSDPSLVPITDKEFIRVFNKGIG